MSKIQNYQVSLKVILKNKKGETLILKSEEYGSYKGYYDFPGGRIDEDEVNLSYKEIIHREILEEVGDIKYNLSLKPVSIGRHFVPAHLSRSTGKWMGDLYIMYIFFEADYLDGDIKISNEHTKYKWVDLNSVKLDKLFISGILEGMEMYTRYFV